MNPCLKKEKRLRQIRRIDQPYSSIFLINLRTPVDNTDAIFKMDKTAFSGHRSMMSPMRKHIGVLKHPTNAYKS